MSNMVRGRPLRFPTGWGLALALLLMLLARTLSPTPHEAGTYQFNVAWQREPAVAGASNSLYLRIRPKATNEPAVEEIALQDLEKTLQAEVIVEGEHIPLVLQPISGEVGVYEAQFTPALPGRYLLHVMGALGDELLDETFDSGQGDFAPVQQGSTRLWRSLGEAALVGTVLGLLTVGLRVAKRRRS